MIERNEIRNRIKAEISCTRFLDPAPNYKGGNTGYICPACGSGKHRGSKSTGAVEFYPDTNKWYCHKCKAGGDVLDLFQEAAHVDYNEALAELAREIGIILPDNSENDTSEKNDRAEGHRSHEAEARQGLTPLQAKTPENGAQSATEAIDNFSLYYDYCNCGRITDPAAIDYLNGRGISIETANKCNLGFDAAADPATAPGSTGNEYKPHPAPRIIIPCTNDFYIARSIDPATPEQYKAPNPAGSKTKPFLYSLRDPANSIIFITEGVFDALAFIECGAAALALNGAGNTDLLLSYIDKLRPQNKTFIICQDNDENPDTASTVKQHYENLKKGLIDRGYKTIIYNVAGIYHDANDALQADRQEFENNIKNAIQEATPPDLLAQFFSTIQTERYQPIKTGLAFFDDLLGGGITRQDLLLLLAPPGSGKTTLAQQIAEAMAASKQPVKYLNFEMSSEQMLAKAISARLRNRTAKEILQGYKWTEADRQIITDAIDSYRQTNYPYIEYSPEGVTTDLASIKKYLNRIGEAAKAAGDNGPAVFVDYLHYIRDGENDIANTIKAALEAFKQYAMAYNTFVIAIAATNREANRGGKITLSSGRDTSNIEYNADYQISLNYKDIDNGNVTATDLDKLAELQRGEKTGGKRAMILRSLKARLDGTGQPQYIMFDAAHNIFYGTDDFSPADNINIFDNDIDRI